MKRGMTILLFILVLAYSTNAMVVELVSPIPDGITFQDINSKDVKCKVTKNETEELTSLNVYYENNESTTWQAGSSAQSNPTSATEYTFSLTSLVNATYIWNCKAINNESNEQFADSNLGFNITFTTAAPPAANHAPELLITLVDRTWLEDTVNVSNLSYFFNDSDGDALTFAVVESPTGISVSISNGGVTYTPNANWTGNTSVMFSASDGTDTVRSNPVSLTVTPVNDPPVASLIPNQNWNENANKTIDLGDYFSDVDDSSLNYSYAFNSSSPYITAVIKDDGDAVLTPETDWYGSEIITFTAYDSANLSFTSNEVTLTVQEINQTGVNQAPNIDTLSPEADPTISVGESQTFSITKSDPDGDDMNVTWYVDNVIQEGETSDSFTYTASAIGSYIIKVAISDGKLSDTNSWALTVGQAQVTTNKTTSTEEEEPENETTACGDGVCSDDEKQSDSCYRDCGCPVSGYVYDEAKGKCIKEGKSGNLILLIVVVGLFLGGAGVALYFYKKKQEEDIFGGLANVPFEPPPKEVILGPKIRVEPKKREVKPQEPKKIVEESVRKPAEKHQTTSQVLLKKYIIDNLKKGKSLEQIKDELRKVGWTSEQVDEAYTAAQLDEAFS